MNQNEDVWVLILSYLQVKERLNCRLVCQLLKKAINSSLLWNNLELNDNNIKSLEFFTTNIHTCKQVVFKDCIQLCAKEVSEFVDAQVSLHSFTCQNLALNSYYRHPVIVNTNMTMLHITNCLITGNCLQKWLELYPNLLDLSCESCEALMDNFTINNHKLIKLNLSGVGITFKFLNSLQLPHLKSLSIAHCYTLEPYPKALSFVHHFELLETLDISLNIQLFDLMPDLYFHKSLKKLNLRGIKNIPESHLNRLFDTIPLTEMLDPLGKWKYH